MRDLRQRAAVLNAASANTLLHRYLPYLMGKLTVPQLSKIQRVLDAAVVNESIKREYKDVYRRSIVAKSGGLVMRDPQMIDKADNLADSMIRLTDDEFRVQIVPELLLEPKALVPRTSNPDEATYMVSVLGLLHARGVWLRITQPYVKDPKDLSQHMIDPRQFELWLSLGPDGEQIPTHDGMITRESLLSTVKIGEGYYRSVFEGKVEYSLKRLENKLEAQIETGKEQHERLIKRRTNAGAVGTVSDWFGDAELPSPNVWDKPFQLIMKGKRANTVGNPQGCYAYYIAAAISIRSISRLLAEYARKSSDGAGEVVTILKVLKEAGEVAEKLLFVYDVTGMAVRGGMLVSSKLAARSAAKKTATVAAKDAAEESVDDLATKVLKEYTEKNPGLADDLNDVRVVKGPKGNISGNRKGGHSSGIGGTPKF